MSGEGAPRRDRTMDGKKHGRRSGSRRIPPPPEPPRRRPLESEDWPDGVSESGVDAHPLPAPAREDGTFSESGELPASRHAGSSSARSREYRAPDNWKDLLEVRLRLLPRQSGVYLFRDERGRVIYVGKAKQLHGRVRSYFRGSAPDRKVRELRRRTRILDWMVTTGEVEALVLENSLIKQYAPPFNIRLKDDKRYPYIRVNLMHPYPGMFITRSVLPDGSRYFGPFTRVRDLRTSMRTLRSVFRLRNCTDRRLEKGGRECLQFFIGRCTAPCVGRVDRVQYADQVAPLVGLLSGRGEEALEALRARMLAAAGDLQFEESARLRDEIARLRELLGEGALVVPRETEAEVVGLAARGNLACAVFLHLQKGHVVGKSQRLLAGVREESQASVLRSLLLSAFLDSAGIPARIICPLVPVDSGGLEEALSAAAGRQVRIVRGDRQEVLPRLLRLASRNAHLLLEEEELRKAGKSRRVSPGVYELQEALRLDSPPYVIEGYDISNTQGSHPVASRVVFRDGKPLKSDYRRYTIRSVNGPNDIAMMDEVLTRRFQRLREEGGRPPDLILVDGGAGQVACARQVLERTGFADLHLLGLAKRLEEIVLPRTGRPLRLPRSSEALRLLQRIRDEAHRFAVGHHRSLRARTIRASALDSIPGVGPARRRAILRRFGSLRGILEAGPDELADVPGLGPKTAKTIWEALHEAGTNQGAGPGEQTGDPAPEAT